jgi:hypothetical protein
MKKSGHPKLSVRRVMRIQNEHWLDYDPVAVLVLLVGIGAVILVAFSF